MTSPLPVRKKNRLPNWDYRTHGLYFVTVCTQEHKNTLCRIVGDGFPVPKNTGKIAEAVLLDIPRKYSGVSIDKYVIMPNHIHILLFLHNESGTADPSPTNNCAVQNRTAQFFIPRISGPRPC